MAEEKIYTVPLRREFLKVARYNRSKKAVKALKEFLLRHLKEEVKIGKYLNEEVTKRRKNPPGKVKIRVEGEKGKYKAELVNAPREEVKEEKKKGKMEKLKEKVVGKKEQPSLEKNVDEEKKKVLEKKLDEEVVVKPKKEEKESKKEKVSEKKKKVEIKDNSKK